MKKGDVMLGHHEHKYTIRTAHRTQYTKVVKIHDTRKKREGRRTQGEPQYTHTHLHALKKKEK